MGRTQAINDTINLSISVSEARLDGRSREKQELTDWVDRATATRMPGYPILGWLYSPNKHGQAWKSTYANPCSGRWRSSC
jgi:hypothetical protein